MKILTKVYLFAAAIIVAAFLTTGASLGPVAQWTAYTFGFTTNSSASSSRTYLGVAALTNTAQLDQNQTFTQTNTFTNVVLSGQVRGGMRILYALPAPVTFTNIQGNWSSNPVPSTNILMPALASPNSVVYVTYAGKKIATGSTLAMSIYNGANTNWDYSALTTNLCAGPSLGGGTVVHVSNTGQLKLFSNVGSFTSQLNAYTGFAYFGGGNFYTNTANSRPNFDTSTNWFLGFAFADQSSSTNELTIEELTVFEYAPLFTP